MVRVECRRIKVSPQASLAFPHAQDASDLPALPGGRRHRRFHGNSRAGNLYRFLLQKRQLGTFWEHKDPKNIKISENRRHRLRSKLPVFTAKYAIFRNSRNRSEHLRGVCRKTCGFKSRPPHQNKKSSILRGLGFLFFRASLSSRPEIPIGEYFGNMRNQPLTNLSLGRTPA